MRKENEGALSQAEINALLAGVDTGVDMSSGRDIVVTAYGHDGVIDKIVSIILHLNETGEIVIAHAGDDELVVKYEKEE